MNELSSIILNPKRMANVRSRSSCKTKTFILTQAPQEDYFSVHIRTVGDWTTAMSKLCTDGGETKASNELPR